MKNYSPNVVRKVRNFFIGLLALHLLLLVEKLLFNIFGYVYLLIVLDAVTSCFLVLTIWATWSFVPRPLTLLVVWLVPWVMFNGFVIIVYSGLLHVPQEYYWLNLKVRRLKWLHEEVFGCLFNSTTPTQINNFTLQHCYVTYEYVEVLHSAVQILLSVVNVGLSCWLSGKFKIEEEEEYFSFFGGFDSQSARAPPTESSLPKIKYVKDDMH